MKSCKVSSEQMIQELRAHMEDLGTVIALAQENEEYNAELYSEISRLRNVLRQKNLFHFCYPEGKALILRQLRHEDLQQHVCVCVKNSSTEEWNKDVGARSRNSPLSMHTYIHTYTHIHTHTYIHTYVHTYIHIHAYIHTHTCIHTYPHTHIHTHTYIHTYVHTYIHIHAYIHTHTCIHTYTYIHTYIHTYIEYGDRFLYLCGHLSKILQELSSQRQPSRS